MKIKDFYKKNQYLITRLVIPLLVLALFSFVLSEYVIHDTLINFGTEFVSIIITILYVDQALLKQRKKLWEVPIQLVKDECGQIGHKYISDIGEHLGLSGVIFPKYDHKSFSVREFQIESLKLTRNITRESIHQSLTTFDRADWVKLLKQLEQQKSLIYQNLNTFASQLEPNELTSYLKYKDIIAGLVINVDFFLPFLGIPIDQLPELTDGKDPYDYTRIATIRTAIDLKEGFDNSVLIIELFGYQAQESNIDYNEEISKMW